MKSGNSKSRDAPLHDVYLDRSPKSPLLESANQVLMHIEKQRFKLDIPDHLGVTCATNEGNQPLQNSIRLVEGNVAQESKLYNLLKAVQDSTRHVVLSKRIAQQEYNSNMDAYQSAIANAGIIAHEVLRCLWTMDPSAFSSSDSMHRDEWISNATLTRTNNDGRNILPKDFHNCLSSLFLEDRVSLSVASFLSVDEYSNESLIYNDWVQSLASSLCNTTMIFFQSNLTSLYNSCPDCVQSLSVLEQWKNNDDPSIRKSFIQSYLWLSLPSMVSPLISRQLLGWITSLLHDSAMTALPISIRHPTEFVEATTIPAEGNFSGLDIVQITMKFDEKKVGEPNSSFAYIDMSFSGPTLQDNDLSNSLTRSLIQNDNATLGDQSMSEEAEASQVLAQLIPQAIGTPFLSLLIPILQRAHFYVLLPTQLHQSLAQSVSKWSKGLEGEQIYEQFTSQLGATLQTLSSTFPSEAYAFCEKDWSIGEIPQLIQKFVILFFYVIQLSRVTSLWIQFLPEDLRSYVISTHFGTVLHPVTRAFLRAVQHSSLLSTSDPYTDQIIDKSKLSLLLLWHYFVLDNRKQWPANLSTCKEYMVSLKESNAPLGALCSQLRQLDSTKTLLGSNVWHQVESNLLQR